MMFFPEILSEDKDFAKKVSRLEFIKRVAIIFAAIIGLLNAILVIGLLYRINDGTKASIATQDSIEDCVKPKGNCYRNGQVRTQNVLDSVGVIIILSNSCSDELGTQSYNEVRACVYSKLDKELNNAKE